MNEILFQIEENIKKVKQKDIYKAVKYEAQLKEIVRKAEILNEEIKGDMEKGGFYNEHK